MATSKTTPPQPERVLFDVPGSANYLRTTERWVRRAIAERRFAVIKLGGLIRIDKADLDAYVAASRREAGGE